MLRQKGTREGRRQAIESFQQIIELSRIKKDKVWEIVAIVQMGLIYDQLGELQKSIDAHELGAVRGEGKLPELNLSSSAASATLQLNIESVDYKVYRAEVVDADGKIIWRGHKLTARNLKISLFVPAARLPGGDYIVKLAALNQRHETESVADFPFRVSRK